MDLSLRERLARLGPIRDVDRVSSGSPALFVLRLPPDRPVARPVDAMLALAHRGMTMLRAKRAIESLLADGTVFVRLPTLEEPAALASDLAAAGVVSALVEAPATPDVRSLRESLNLSREQFADRYGLDVDAVRNWETGRRQPDLTAKSYLRVIAQDPGHVERAYAPTP